MLRAFFSGAILGCALALLFLPRGLGEAVPLVHAVEQLTAPEPQVTIFALGDLMLDREVRQYIDAYGPTYPFAEIAPELAGHDLVVANAEGIFSDNASVASPTTLVFTFATSTLPVLKALGFTDLSQANNHALNFGWSGLQASQQLIGLSGMHSFGDPDNSNPGPVYEQVRGTAVAFVGYDEFSQSHSDESVLGAIEAAHKNGAFTVVYAHWGQEYDLSTTALQESEAHKFIDAGADVVFGAHPHVVEPIEVYNGKPIFYSLGNFIFDQSWSADVSHGIAVEVSLKPAIVTYTVLPFSIVHAQAVPEGTSTSFTLPR